MERKKVSILLPWLKMGGTNKIALNFMKELSQFCDVTLILTERSGELLDQLPENIHLIVDPPRPFRDLFCEDLRHLRLRFLAWDLLYYAKIRLGRDSVDNYRYLVSRQAKVCDTEFDCAISYHGQSPELLLNLLLRIRAKKKAAWIHGEFSAPPDHCRRMEKYYGQLDRLFFVSRHTKAAFLARFPMDPDRCTVYYNPIDKQEILAGAAEPCLPEFSGEYINLLTVGRLSPEKGQDMIPSVTRRLLDMGHPIRWYLIGDGDTRQEIEALIEKHNVSGYVVLLGTRANPYCFMKACDIYVQPSYTEGYATTICEAGILGKAIVATRPSGGIGEQLTHGEDGLIVEATPEGLTQGIQLLLADEPLRHRLEENIRKRNFEGKGEITKFLAFLHDDP